MSERLSLRVNGVERTPELDPALPLLALLRGELDLMGARFGCGAGQCGACNVLVEGRAVASCETPLWAVAGKDVVTVEGLGTPERPHALQEAFVAEQAIQCGYCVSGILISAAREQQLVQLVVSGLRRCMKWDEAPLLPGIWVGAVLEQETSHGRVPAGRCAVKRLDTERVARNCAHIRAALEQHPDRLRMAVIRRQDEQRVPRSAGEVHRHAAVDDGRQLLRPAFTGHVEHAPQEVELLLSQVLGHAGEATPAEGRRPISHGSPASA